MKISEIIERLDSFKEKYGDLEVLGSDEYPLEEITIQKFIKTCSDYNNIIRYNTEDLDEIFLEKMYEEDEENTKYFVSKGLCLKVY